jgi:hypothetical protein
MSSSLPVAYSHLPQVLAKCRLKISELHERLKAAGVNVNQKSLYRLTTSEPLQKIDTRIVGAICQTCSVGIQDVITFEHPKPVLQKLTASDQKRFDHLMTKHNEGELNAAEMQEFDELSDKAHQLTMANARMLVAQRRALNAARRPLIIRRLHNASRKRAESAKRVLKRH